MFKNIIHLSLLSSLAFSLHVHAAELSVSIRNQDGTTVDPVILFAEPLDHKAPDRVVQKVEIAQEGKAFAPFMTVMQHENSVMFTNRDDFTHHIYSISDDNRFSFKLKSDESHEMTPNITDSGHAQISMGCNIHDWMSGHLLVVNTPYFTRTNTDGQAQLQLEQAGQYKITLWHPQFRSDNQIYTRTIEFKGDTIIEWSLPETLVVRLPEASTEEFDFIEQY
ncbi:hypothetical protein [Oceanospirillum sediminis]|uniref:RNase III domain-containing protein n=1 Tax=Oceanospirillum sediminis TaxID=2760088 RepID=A0A839IRJ4_9GAMM|nr:hypothetical protein [Oceanospirillum sediminis]MBB1487568.1 hypothetical protein [Oceanospirillum sediminis]